MEYLAGLVALVAMGQAAHAAEVIRRLDPVAPAIRHEDLKRDAIRRLTVSGSDARQRDALRWHRDGFIFEAIAWIATQQQASELAVIRDPHVSATMQGLDGLMIEVDPTRQFITRVTISEDKCTGDLRRTFRKVMRMFSALHVGERSAELVASASSLLAEIGLRGTARDRAADSVRSLQHRVYRSSFAISIQDDTEQRRSHLFRGYEELGGLTPEQRIAATFVTSDDLRCWFDSFAGVAIRFLDRMAVTVADV